MNAKLHKTFPLYWWTAPLRQEWLSFAWECVIKIQYGKSLFSFICLALKCLHWGPKSFSAKNVSFWSSFFPNLLMPSLCGDTFILKPLLQLWWECSFQAWIMDCRIKVTFSDKHLCVITDTSPCTTLSHGKWFRLYGQFSIDASSEKIGTW